LVVLAVLSGLIVALAIGVAFMLHNQRFHDYVLARARQSASESLGVAVELQNFALHFHGINPTLDLYGLVVHGAAPYADPPLLQAEQARIRVSVVSLLQATWYLNEVALHHVVVQIRVDANGRMNLPNPPQKSANGIQTLFDLAVRHAVLDNGEIYYNDRKSALDADMREVTLNAGFDAARHAYVGRIAYADGHLKSGAYGPVPHALRAEFELTPSRLEVRKAELRSGASAIAFSATVDGFANPRVAMEYHASVDAAELRQWLRNTSRNAELPLGAVQLDGRAEYAAKPNQPPLNAVTLNGTLGSERLEFRSQSARIEAHALRATYSLANGDAEIASLRASLLGGTMNARMSVKNLMGEQMGAAHVKLDGISLASLKQLSGAGAGHDAAAKVTLAGTLQAVSDASWKGSLQTLTATADATVHAEAGSTHITTQSATHSPTQSATQSASSTVPVTGEVHASYRNQDQLLTLRQSSFRTALTTLTLDGTVGERSQMNLTLKTQELHELETIAALFSKPLAQPLGVYGSAMFAGTLSGPVSGPTLAGDLSAEDLQVRGTEWKLLRAHVDAGPSAVGIQSGQLVPAAAKGALRGNIAFSGRAQLTKWAFTPNSPFQVTVNAQKLDAGPLVRLAGSTQPVSGTLNANLQAHGTELNPLGNGRVELLRANVAGEPVQSAQAQFDGDGNAAHVRLKVTMPAGATTGTVTYYPRQRAYEAQLESRNFKLDQLQTVKAHNLSIAGAMNLVASGRGTLDDPQLTASLEIPRLQAQGQTIDHLSLHANVARHALIATLNASVMGTNVQGKAAVQLTGDYAADVALDTQQIPLQPLLAVYAPEQAANVTGQTELHATLRGPLKQPARIEAHVVIPELHVQYQKSLDLAVSGPIHADYADGVLTLQRSELKGTGTDLQFQGSLPLLDRAKPVALMLIGTVDLRLAQLFDPDVTSSGQLRFNINSSGTRSDLGFNGDVQIVNANVTMADTPFGLASGNGTLALTRDRLNIASFEGMVGGGKITVRGGIAYRPSVQFDIALAGKGIRMLVPDGVREEASANLTLTGTPAQAALRGQINVDQLSFTPDFDLANLSQFGGGVDEPPSLGLANNVQLNVTLRSSQDVNVVGRTLSVSGAANLRLTGTAAQPVVLGRINLSGGDLIFRGNRYVLQSGLISFVNATQTEPDVNLSLTTSIQQYNIALRFKGPPDRLRTTYSSDPALPSAKIINLLAFGSTQGLASPTASSGTSNTLTAEQSIASAVSGQATGPLEKLAGISSLSVDPTLANGQQNAGATVTVKQRVTSKIFVNFATDVTGTQQQVIQLEYQVTPKVSVSGTRDQNGGFGFETRITREW
jgi:translocation and assembly module TamB